MIWPSFIVLTWVDHHSFHFLIVFFCIPLPLSRSSFHFLSIPYLLIPITDLIPFSHHSHISLMVWLLIFLSFRHRHFLWLPLGPWLMRFFYALHLVHEGMGLIIGYLSLVSLHFFHPITLAYVTSCVLRPPWGHEIICILWQPLLRLVFGIWFIYRRCPISSFGRCFFDAWRWFGDGCGRLLHFIDDIWCYPDFHSTMHQLSYWGIFPFHLVKMSP